MRDVSAEWRPALRSLLVIACSLVAGCANKPLPEDVARGYDTVDIVDKIRCESREAVYRELLALLAERGAPAAVVRSIMNTPGEIRESDLDALPSHLRSEIDDYYNAGIAYDFKLNMTVNNVVEGSVTAQDS